MGGARRLTPLRAPCCRTAPVALSLCLYGIESDELPPTTPPRWERLPSFSRFVHILDANAVAVLPEAAEVVSLVENPTELAALAAVPSAPSAPSPPTVDELVSLRERLESASTEIERLAELEQLQVVLPAALALWPSLPDAELCAVAVAVTRVLGSDSKAADAGLSEISVALELLTLFAGHDAAGRALTEEGTIEVLLLWILDGMCGVSLRCELLGALTALLHHPVAMKRFTVAPESPPAAADDSTPAEPAEPGYQQMMRLMLEPMPPMLSAPPALSFRHAKATCTAVSLLAT